MAQGTRPKGILYTALFYFAIAVVLVILCIVIQPLWNWFTTGSISTLPIGINHDLGYNINKYLGFLYGTDGTGFIVLFVICAAIVAIDAVSLIQLKSWGRLLAMLIALPLIIIILGIVVLWYLMKPEVKQAFGVPVDAASLSSAPRVSPAEAKAKQQQLHAKDGERFQAAKALVEKGSEIPLKDLAGALEISPNDLTRYIMEWSKDLGIKIKGASVLIAPSDVAGVLERLEQDMADWTR